MRWVYLKHPNSYIEKKTDNSWIEVNDMRFASEYNEVEERQENGNPVVILKNEEGSYIRLSNDKIMHGYNYNEDDNQYLYADQGYWVLQRISNYICLLFLKNSILFKKHFYCCKFIS